MKRFSRNEVIKLAKLPCLLFGLLVALGTSTVAGTVSVQSPADSNVELARASENAKALEKKYQKVKRLNELGSASQRQVRKADLDRGIAALELSTLREPALRDKNLFLMAKLVLRYRDEELKITRDLFSHGSVSELKLLRAVTARDVAQSNLDAIQSTSETIRKLHLIQIAKSRYELAQRELEIANRLVQTGSISQPALDRAKSNLKIALSELESRKKSLGARATQVRKQ